MSITALIVGLIILAIVYWVVKQIPLPIPEWLINVLFGLVAIIILLQAFGVDTGINFRL